MIAPARKIEIEAVRKRFQTTEALARLDLSIAEGEFVCLVGPSGCGKTTLLRMLAGLETPDEGELRIRHTNPCQPLTAMIFQENAIFPWMTVRENVGFGLALRSANPHSQVDRFLDLTGLAAFADAYPYQLSGGMKQRTSVARAFVHDPEILLMDEPFAALDEQTRLLLQQELLRLWSGSRKTVLFITHSIDEAIALADRVLVMSPRPGRLLADFFVPFARPRAVHEMRSDPAFGALWREVWELLRS